MVLSTIYTTDKGSGMHNVLQLYKGISPRNRTIPFPPRIWKKKERFGFYGPFKNISLISSRSLIKSWAKTGVPGEKPPDLPIQNLASHILYKNVVIAMKVSFLNKYVYTCNPSQARTTAVRDPMFKSHRS